MTKKSPKDLYHRYHIETKKAPPIKSHPHSFNVRVKRLKLAKFLVQELIQYKGNLKVVMSRPCVYGVFSGPLGGFAPREKLCVGCLRCTTQYPDMVTITHNPKRAELGDSYFLPYHIDAIVYEAQLGRIPIRGAGYRGKFGGTGWDGMWTDMSEIVRPTRDGIHGREYISTEVDIGAKRAYIELDKKNQPVGYYPPTYTISIPLLFDAPPTHLINETFAHILSEAAYQIKSLSILPIETILQYRLKGSAVVPLVSLKNYRDLEKLNFVPPIIEIEDWDEEAFKKIQKTYPKSILILRTEFQSDLMYFFQAGIRNFHLTANYHGRSADGRFVLDCIRHVHRQFIKACIREEVTLLGSGGIIAAEHLPKAIICGLDAVVLDTPLFVALQAKFAGPCVNRQDCHLSLPPEMKAEWGKQRLKNMAASWRDQLLEILGAMGLREVRRLRGEIGRAMFQKDFENEAFAGIEGY
jgi:hypothetical protein